MWRLPEEVSGNAQPPHPARPPLSPSRAEKKLCQILELAFSQDATRLLILSIYVHFIQSNHTHNHTSPPPELPMCVRECDSGSIYTTTQYLPVSRWRCGRGPVCPYGTSVRSPCTLGREMRAVALRAVVRSLLERAADGPNAETARSASPSPAAQRPQLPAAHACDEDGEEPLQRLLGHAHLARVKLRVRVRARDRDRVKG